MSEKEYLKLIIGKDSQDEDKGYKARTPKLEQDVERMLKKPLQSIKSKNEQIIDFASNHDIPYRLKKTEDFLVFYGYEFARDIHFNILTSVSDFLEIPYDEAHKNIITPSKYIKIINEKIPYTMLEVDSEAERLDVNTIKRYIQSLEQKDTFNTLNDFMRKESETRRNYFLNRDLTQKILDNNHLEMFIKYKQ